MDTGFDAAPSKKTAEIDKLENIDNFIVMINQIIVVKLTTFNFQMMNQKLTVNFFRYIATGSQNIALYTSHRD